MATIITITKEDTKKSIQQKLQGLIQNTDNKKGFAAACFTSKITSFGDGIDYQRTARDEWK